MVNLPKALETLALTRPVFHSEADFQHALAWTIHQHDRLLRIRLELATRGETGRMHLDLCVADAENKTAIELKYKTRGLQLAIDGEEFDLTNQVAHDVGSYEFLKDVERLEQIVSSRSDAEGYAILLTNDSAYWKAPRQPETLDADFRLFEGRTVAGELRWRPTDKKGSWTMSKPPVSLRSSYLLRWADYSQPSKASYGRFRYLIIQVAGGGRQ